MRKRKYLIGALVGVIGALAFSGVASAAPTGQTLQTTLAPAKQDKKTFGGVSRAQHHQHHDRQPGDHAVAEDDRVHDRSEDVKFTSAATSRPVR